MKTFTCAAVSVVLLASVAVADEPSVEDIRQQAIGKWERTMENSDGETMRMVKDVRENEEIVTWYNAEGEVAGQGTNKYKIDIVNGVCVFTLTWVDGPRQVYAFRIHNDQWHEIHGLRLGAEGSPRYNVFKRVKE